MRSGFVGSVVTLLLCAGASVAQLPAFERIRDTNAPPMIAAGNLNDGSVKTPRGFVDGEYLNWWISRGPVGVPLVTTGNPASPTAGAIGDSSTVVLFGNSGIDYGPIHGGRLRMGYWFGDEARFGIEGSGFLFARKTDTFRFASDATGNPLLAIPFQTPGGVESRFLVSNPVTGQTGNVVITSSTRFWGADANGVLNVLRNCNCSLDLLAGFRYLDLQESLEIDPSSNLTRAIVLRDKRVVVNAQATFRDQFNTRNQFYGGQLGSRAAFQWGRLSLEALGMVALGFTEHTLYTAGSTNATVNGVVVPLPPGGVFTATSNLGTFHTHNFSVVPQTQVKLGYDITRNLRVTVGYDALYWTGVNRPGNQIDHVVGTGLPGQTNPAPGNTHSNFWAQGVSAGLEVRW